MSKMNDVLKTESFWVVRDGTGVMFESPSMGWKQYIDVFRSPKQVAKELRKIAAWLEKLEKLGQVRR